MREYVRDDLLRLSRFLRLEIVEIRGADHMLSRLSPKVRPPYLLLTKFFPGLKDSWLLLARKPEEWKPKTELSQEELEAILARSTSYQYKNG